MNAFLQFILRVRETQVVLLKHAAEDCQALKGRREDVRAEEKVLTLNGGETSARFAVSLISLDVFQGSQQETVALVAALLRCRAKASECRRI